MAIKKPQLISFSFNAILKVLAVVIGVYVLWTIKDIVGLVFVAWVFSSAVIPIVDYLQRKHIPRIVSVLGIVVLFAGILTLLGIMLVPPLSAEITEISNIAPTYITQFKGLQESIPFDLAGSLKTFSQQITDISGQLLGAIMSLFGGIFTFIAVIVLTFYMIVEENAVKKLVQSFAPLNYQPYIIKKIHEVQDRLGGWLRGQLILSLIVGAMTYIGLVIIGVKYALVIALITGLLEFVPLIGAILSAIPAVFFALMQSPWKALFVVILFIIIHQTEGHLIQPNVMKRSVGLSPLIIIIALLIGAEIAGIIGTLLAVPVAVIISVFTEDLFVQKKKEETKLEKG